MGEYHHFVGDNLTRSEKVQRWVVYELINSKVPQDKRESSVIWELKHSSAVMQMARLLAQKRGVNEELAEIAAVLHDVCVIVEGDYKDHAKRGAVIASKILHEIEGFSSVEIVKICRAIENHSNKHIYTDDSLSELIKDADCLDCFFYGDKVYDYKPKEFLKHYYNRIVKLREELGLPKRKYFEQRLNEIW